MVGVYFLKNNWIKTIEENHRIYRARCVAIHHLSFICMSFTATVITRLSYRRDSLSNQTIHLATVGKKNPCLIRRDLLQRIKKGHKRTKKSKRNKTVQKTTD